MTSILKWKKAYESFGESGLENVRKSTEESKAMKELLRENAMLKKLVANKELTIMIQKEMIKKAIEQAFTNDDFTEFYFKWIWIHSSA